MPKQIRKEAIFEEYRILRGEIQQYHAERNSYVNYSITFTGALIALISASANIAFNINFLLAIIPNLYVVLGFLFLDRSVRIIRLADYIHNHLRPELCELTDTSVWNWEIYKKNTKRFPKVIAIFLDQIRILAFIAPAFLCFALFFMRNTDGYSIGEILFLGTSCAGIIFLIIVIWIVEETSGAEHANYLLRWQDDIERPRTNKNN